MKYIYTRLEKQNDMVVISAKGSTESNWHQLPPVRKTSAHFLRKLLEEEYADIQRSNERLYLARHIPQWDGEKLKAWREHLQMTQTQFGDAITLSQTCINKHESSKALPHHPSVFYEYVLSRKILYEGMCEKARERARERIASLSLRPKHVFRLRQQLQMTQAEFAEVMGVGRKSVSHLENYPFSLILALNVRYFFEKVYPLSSII